MASARAERVLFMAYFIVVRGAGGSVNESGGKGEGVVKPDAKQAVSGEQRHESLIAQPLSSDDEML